MERSVEITIEGTQKDVDSNKNTINAKEKGRFFKKEKASYVIATSEDETQTSKYKFNHRFLEVTRNGDVTSKLYFEAGKEYTTRYRTPYGGIDISIVTSQYTIEESPEGVTVFAKYAILTQGEVVSENTLMGTFRW